jgi:hypothetical protein
MRHQATGKEKIGYSIRAKDDSKRGQNKVLHEKRA